LLLQLSFVDTQLANLGPHLGERRARPALLPAPIIAPDLAPEAAQLLDTVAGAGEHAKRLCDLPLLLLGERFRVPADNPAKRVKAGLVGRGRDWCCRRGRRGRR
jgi:hypothetical protein